MDSTIQILIFYFLLHYCSTNSEDLDFSITFDSLDPQVGKKFCFNMTYLNEDGVSMFTSKFFNCKASYLPELIYSTNKSGELMLNNINEVHNRLKVVANQTHASICFTYLQRRDLENLYIWEINASNKTVTKEVILPLRSYYPPSIYSVSKYPPIVIASTHFCMLLKYSHHPLAPLHVIKIQISPVKGHERIWTDIIVVKDRLAVIINSSYIFERLNNTNTAYDMMCLQELSEEDANYDFQWIIEDFHRKKSTKIFSLASFEYSADPFIFYSLEFTPLIMKDGEPGCVKLSSSNNNRTLDPVTTLLFYIAYPDFIRTFNLVYDCSLITQTCKSIVYPNDKSMSDIINRIDKNLSTFTQICFSKMSIEDHFSLFRWSLKTKSNKIRSLDFSFRIFTQSYELPILLNLSPASVYSLHDEVSYSCSAPKVSIDASLSWFINEQLASDNFVFDQPVPMPDLVKESYVTSLKSNLIFKITNSLTFNKTNVIVKCVITLAQPSLNIVQSYEVVVPIKGVLPSTSIIHFITVSPSKPEYNKYFCITADFEVDPNFYLLYSELTIKSNDTNNTNIITNIIFRHHNHKNTFPNTLSTIYGVIDAANTLKNHICFNNAKAFPETTFVWTIADRKGSIHQREVTLQIEEPPPRIRNKQNAVKGAIIGALICVFMLLLILGILIRKKKLLWRQGKFKIMNTPDPTASM